MGNIRTQQVNHSQSSKDQAEVAKDNAGEASTVLALSLVTQQNSDAIITLADAVIRLDGLIQQMRNKTGD